mgnify:CR=1 FL=1
MQAYLDNSATTPLSEETKQYLIELLDAYGNPSSSHSIGQSAKQIISEARKSVAKFINTDVNTDQFIEPIEKAVAEAAEDLKKLALDIHANPELGNELYEKFLSICAELGYPPQHGRFGADMKVESINDGPVTLILDTDQLMDTPRR